MECKLLNYSDCGRCRSSSSVALAIHSQIDTLTHEHSTHSNDPWMYRSCCALSIFKTQSQLYAFGCDYALRRNTATITKEKCSAQHLNTLHIRYRCCYSSKLQRTHLSIFIHIRWYKEREREREWAKNRPNRWKRVAGGEKVGEKVVWKIFPLATA